MGIIGSLVMMKQKKLSVKKTFSISAQVRGYEERKQRSQHNFSKNARKLLVKKKIVIFAL